MLLRGRDIPCPWLCKIWPWKPFMNTNAFHAHKHTYIHACLSAWSMPRDISTRIVHELWAFPGEGESRPNHRKWDRCWTSGGQRKTLSYVTTIRGIRVFRRDDVIGKGATVGGGGIFGYVGLWLNAVGLVVVRCGWGRGEGGCCCCCCRRRREMAGGTWPHPWPLRDLKAECHVHIDISCVQSLF